MIRTAVLTGGTGYFGSRLVRLLVQRGTSVALLARDGARWERLQDVREAVLVRSVDTPLLDVFGMAPDLVVHTATCYGRRGESDEEVRAVCFDWPDRLLAEAGAAGVPWFVNCDTSLPVGLDRYADWKAAFRLVACQAALAGQIGVLNLRLETLYGPGDDGTKFVTQLVRALLAGVAEFPMTAGAQSRDYLYIDDAVDAVEVLLDTLREHPPGWLSAGIGRGIPVRVHEFAERLREVAGGSTHLRLGALPTRAGELMEARADLTVLQALRWTPRVSLDEGMRRLIAGERALMPAAAIRPGS